MQAVPDFAKFTRDRGSCVSKDGATPITISIREAVEALGVCRSTVLKLLDQNRLHSVKVGRRRLITIASLKALIEAH